VYSLLLTFATRFQPEISSGSAPSAAPTSAAPTGGMEGALSNFGLIALMMVVFYFVAIRPQQKRQKEHDSLMKALKKGQRVRTNGGIRGEIVDFKSEMGDEVVLLIADKVKVNILRSQISGVVEPGEADKKS